MTLDGRRHTPRLARSGRWLGLSAVAALLAVTALAVVSIGLVAGTGFALSSRFHASQHGGVPAPTATQSAEAVAALASVSSTPATLSAAQAACVSIVMGSADNFRHLSPALQQSVLNSVEDCIAAKEGRPIVVRTVVDPPVPATPDPRSLPIVRQAAGGDGQIYVGGGNYPTHGGQYQFSNAWTRENSPQTVWAGGERYDARPGIIVVTGGVTPPNPALSGSGIFPTPTRHGAVAIVDAMHGTLKLQAVDGTVFYFEVASREYVSGFPAVPVSPVPTAHP